MPDLTHDVVWRDRTEQGRMTPDHTGPDDTGPDHSGPDHSAGQVPVSCRFDDPFYALTDGLAETRHVFLAGNDLPARFRAGFHIAELGFGTGLNLLAVLQAWRMSGAPGPLCVTSFEAFPLSADVMIRAQAAFPDLAVCAQDLA
ncbi:MAG: hypothetical protein ACPGFC_02575, partial [Paracoccaceae bacterium]